MASRSPTVEGFRAVFRHPSLFLAEVAWRWTFGAAACLLAFLTAVEFLDTLAVSAGDLLFLRSRQPFLIAQAFAHIFRGSAPRLVGAMLVLMPALALFWILAGSLGRAATLQALRAGFAPAGPEEESGARRKPRWRFRSLFGLNFLRTALALAGLLGYIGAMILAGLVSSEQHPPPGFAFLIFLPLALVVWLLWSSVAWFLSVASLFVVRDGQDTFGSIAAAVDLCRHRPGPVSAVGFWHGLLHLVAFLAATSAVFFPIAFLGLLPPGFVLIAVLVLTLLYFAWVDFLCVARLAAYVYIAETPAISQPGPLPAAPVPPPGNLPSGAEPEPPASIDQAEVILSDLPLANDPAVG